MSDLAEIVVALSRQDDLYAKALLAIIRKQHSGNYTLERDVSQIERRKRWSENSELLTPPHDATPSRKGMLGEIAAILSYNGIYVRDTSGMSDRELLRLDRMGKRKLAVLREWFPEGAG
tara:strand:- start:1515 stop:1871 length:357 start_codon:yes stop_codon:yes gene_type:complete